jgi:hypothetical protein
MTRGNAIDHIVALDDVAGLLRALVATPVIGPAPNDRPSAATKRPA